jgi:hypothetical protein
MSLFNVPSNWVFQIAFPKQSIIAGTLQQS